MELKDFVRVHKNKKNNQTKLEVKKRDLKKSNLSIDDILNSKINSDKLKFNNGKRIK